MKGLPVIDGTPAIVSHIAARCLRLAAVPLVLAAIASDPAAEPAPQTLQKVQRIPAPIASAKADIEKELETLKSLCGILEGYAKEYPNTRRLKELTAAREPVHAEAVRKLSSVPEMLNRFDSMIAGLQMQAAMVLLDRGNYAKAHFAGEELQQEAQKYFLAGGEFKAGMLDLAELREIFPRKATESLNLARKTVEAEDAAFREACEARDAMIQTWTMAGAGAAVAASLLALGVVIARRRR